MTESTAIKPRRRGLIIATALVGLVAIIGGAKAMVYAHAGPTLNAEFIADHVEHAVKYVLSDVDATSEQKAQVTSILQATATDLRGLIEQHRTARTQFREALSAPSIDRAKLETLRVEQMAVADQASKRFLQGIEDSAEVLSPDQRVKLAALAEKNGRWRMMHD
jgi:protein CpxP